jgi:TolB protein
MLGVRRVCCRVAMAGLLMAGASGVLPAQTLRLPRPVAPFPAGLAGTLVFESDVAGRPGIYTLDLNRGTVSRLTGDGTATERTPRWSPDGRQVVFASNRAHYDEGTARDSGSPDFDIWLVNADGSNPRRLTTDPAHDTDPSWTPDGAGVVFTSERDSRGDLYLLTLATGDTVRLTRHFVGRALMPSVSPASSRTAFAAQTLRMGAFWDYQIHVRDANGTTVPLASTAGACWPRWSPSGERLANVRLSADAPSTLELRDGPALTSSKVLTVPGLWSYYPAWAPDMTRLVFAVSPEHHEGEDWDLAVIDIATGAWRRLTQGAGNDRLPDWKP